MNVERCPTCNKDFIAEEFSNHVCNPRIVPYEKVMTLYYSSFIPLKVNGKDVALLTTEDGKTLYNIKPSPTILKQPHRTTEDEAV